MSAGVKLRPTTVSNKSGSNLDPTCISKSPFDNFGQRDALLHVSKRPSVIINASHYSLNKVGIKNGCMETLLNMHRR